MERISSEPKFIAQPSYVEQITKIGIANNLGYPEEGTDFNVIMTDRGGVYPSRRIEHFRTGMYILITPVTKFYPESGGSLTKYCLQPLPATQPVELQKLF